MAVFFINTNTLNPLNVFFMEKIEYNWTLLSTSVVYSIIHVYVSSDYKFLGIMKRQFPEVPILGLTATATVNVLDDVKKILNIPLCHLFKASFNRPNLYYEVGIVMMSWCLTFLSTLFKSYRRVRNVLYNETPYNHELNFASNWILTQGSKMGSANHEMGIVL